VQCAKRSAPPDVERGFQIATVTAERRTAGRIQFESRRDAEGFADLRATRDHQKNKNKKRDLRRFSGPPLTLTCIMIVSVLSMSRMQRKSFADVECTIARSIEQIGDGWSLMILRSALLGAKRFQDFESQLDAPPTTLTRRLQALTELGFFTRREYESHPRREEYELTEKGLDFLPVLLALAAWGTRWASPGGAPLECVDAETGRLLEPVLVDAQSGKRLVAGKVGLRAGPGASAALRRAMRGVRVVFGACARGGAA
jgi:DNA-binding HxlR family transcriptional regulator